MHAHALPVAWGGVHSLLCGAVGSPCLRSLRARPRHLPSSLAASRPWRELAGVLILLVAALRASIMHHSPHSLHPRTHTHAPSACGRWGMCVGMASPLALPLLAVSFVAPTHPPRSPCTRTCPLPRLLRCWSGESVGCAGCAASSSTAAEKGLPNAAKARTPRFDWCNAWNPNHTLASQTRTVLSPEPEASRPLPLGSYAIE